MHGPMHVSAKIYSTSAQDYPESLHTSGYKGTQLQQLHASLFIVSLSNTMYVSEM